MQALRAPATQSLGAGGGRSASGGRRSPHRAALRSRRSASSAASTSDQTDKPSAKRGASQDLRHVPGIGPANAKLLVAHGLDSIAALSERFSDSSIKGDTQAMADFLSDDVGIIHRSHSRKVAEFCEAKHDEESEKDGASTSGGDDKDGITFAVEGNISVGKTTFLTKIFQGHEVELQELVQIVPEPVGNWQGNGEAPSGMPGGMNMLDAFYEEPQRYAYTFQNYVFVTRALQESRSRASSTKPLRLLERSVFSDRMVFVRAVHEARWLSDMEIELYDSWFDPMVSAMPGLVPDAFIYLRADPKTCMQRLNAKGGATSSSMSHEYLQGLHEKHEEWFNGDSARQRGRSQVLLPSAGNGGDPRRMAFSGGSGLVGMGDDIADDVLYLGNQSGGSAVPSQIDNVPALVLDCNENVNFDMDEGARAAYRDKVKSFFEYVKSSKAEAAKRKRGLVVPPPQAGAAVASDDWQALQAILTRNERNLGPYAPEWLSRGVADMRERMDVAEGGRAMTVELPPF